MFFLITNLDNTRFCVRDVDTFVEKLESTISFFRNLEGKEGAALDDDFQPFI